MTASQEPWLVCALEANRDVPEGSEVYALRGDQLEASRIKRLSAGDLVAQLGDTSARVAGGVSDETGERNSDAS